MGRISHLKRVEKEEPAAYKLEGIISSLGDLMAQGASERISPQLASILSVIEESGSASTTGREKATQAIQQAIRDEISALKPELKKLLDALSSSSRDMTDLQGRLVSALSNVRIPDYSEQLARLEATQPDLSPVLVKIDEIEFPEMEERPTRWVFDIERHQNGLIKRVTAEATG